MSIPRIPHSTTGLKGDSDMKSSRIKTIAYWTTTILGPTSFVIGGVIGLTGRRPGRRRG